MSGTILKTGATILKIADKIVINATDGDIQLSSAKSIVQSSDEKIIHGSYKQPEGEEEEDLLVVEVTGPKEIEAGKLYPFKATSFSRKAFGGELKSLKWAYQIDDGEIIDFKNPGITIANIAMKNITIADSLSDNKTVRIYAYMQAPSKDASVECKVYVDNLIKVTTSKGKHLFSLKPNEKHQSQIITAIELYAKKIQWFCPHADNYLELVKKNEELATFSELKHFSWSDIVTFSEVDRWSWSYHGELYGDWKAVASGGAGYYLVTVGGFPYWTDAIGQIPFAVDTFRMYLERGYSKEDSMKKTFSTGQKHGGGTLFVSKPDYSNSYDNHMILRTCLWATNRYSVKIRRNVGTWDLSNPYKTQSTGHSVSKLKEVLTEQQVQKYLSSPFLDFLEEIENLQKK